MMLVWFIGGPASQQMVRMPYPLPPNYRLPVLPESEWLKYRDGTANPDDLVNVEYAEYVREEYEFEKSMDVRIYRYVSMDRWSALEEIARTLAEAVGLLREKVRG